MRQVRRPCFGRGIQHMRSTFFFVKTAFYINVAWLAMSISNNISKEKLFTLTRNPGQVSEDHAMNRLGG